MNFNKKKIKEFFEKEVTVDAWWYYTLMAIVILDFTIWAIKWMVS